MVKLIIGHNWLINFIHKFELLAHKLPIIGHNQIYQPAAMFYA
jgi:hypothetical protein